MSAVTATRDGVVIVVRVQPRAANSGVAGIDAEWVRVRLQAPPVDGKANEALIAFMATLLGCHKRDVTILSGQTGRLKRIHVYGGNVVAIQKTLESSCR